MMELHTPRVAAVHDLSCFGRCSLAVITPILSCMGIQVCPLPTAILSTHLGGFKDVVLADLTGDMASFYRHWKREGVAFNAIYSGFLASERQIDIVIDFIDEFLFADPLVVVDPVMGDEGRLYSVYTPAMQQGMKRLVGKAHIITPNYTEACFLLGESYDDIVTRPAKLQEWLAALTDLGPDAAVITGIPLAGGSLLNMGYCKQNRQFWQTVSERIPVRYPGTGDIFAGVLVGSVLRGSGLPEATEQAAEFVAEAVRETFVAGTPVREGVLLESMLSRLCRAENNNC